jgi:hypothetical protein
MTPITQPITSNKQTIRAEQKKEKVSPKTMKIGLSIAVGVVVGIVGYLIYKLNKK